MIARPCDFLLWVALTAAATAALGQTVATDTRPAGKIAQTAIPDFSGIWASAEHVAFAQWRRQLSTAGR